jgi:hypothetical protein
MERDMESVCTGALVLTMLVVAGAVVGAGWIVYALIA